jgi:protein-S-isoprenylcysteine O-methyltransferase Ste14
MRPNRMRHIDRQVLVTDGPCRVIRHPSYAGAWSMFVGSSLKIARADIELTAPAFAESDA